MKRYKQRNLNRTGEQLCDICHSREFLVEHHIHGRDVPDPHASSNICNICSNCHYKVHKDVIRLEGWFITTKGRELLWFNPAEAASLTGEEASVHIF